MRVVKVSWYALVKTVILPQDGQRLRGNRGLLNIAPHHPADKIPFVTRTDVLQKPCTK